MSRTLLWEPGEARAELDRLLSRSVQGIHALLPHDEAAQLRELWEEDVKLPPPTKDELAARRREIRRQTKQGALVALLGK